MTYELEWHPLAEADLKNLADWRDAQRIATARERFGDAVFFGNEQIDHFVCGEQIQLL